MRQTTFPPSSCTGGVRQAAENALDPIFQKLGEELLNVLRRRTLLPAPHTFFPRQKTLQARLLTRRDIPRFLRFYANWILGVCAGANISDSRVSAIDRKWSAASFSSLNLLPLLQRPVEKVGRRPVRRHPSLPHQESVDLVRENHLLEADMLCS